MESIAKSCIFHCPRKSLCLKHGSPKVWLPHQDRVQAKEKWTWYPYIIKGMQIWVVKNLKGFRNFHAHNVHIMVKKWHICWVYFSSSTIANLGIKVRSIPGQKQWRWRDLWRSAHGVFQQAWSVHDQSPPVLDSMDLHCPQKVHPEIAGSTIKQGEYTSQKEKIIHVSILVTTCRRYDY